jgi:hypothetical protein
LLVLVDYLGMAAGNDDAKLISLVMTNAFAML